MASRTGAEHPFPRFAATSRRLQSELLYYILHARWLAPHFSVPLLFSLRSLSIFTCPAVVGPVPFGRATRKNSDRIEKRDRKIKDESVGSVLFYLSDPRVAREHRHSSLLKKAHSLWRTRIGAPLFLARQPHGHAPHALRAARERNKVEGRPSGGRRLAAGRGKDWRDVSRQSRRQRWSVLRSV